MSVPANLKDLQDLASHPLIERAVKRLPDIIVAVLVVAIAWQLVQLTWLLVGSVGPIANASLPAAPARAPTTRPGIDPQSIADAHLFGLPSADKAEIDPSSAPQTRMSLVLAGTIASDDASKGFAIIGESAAAAKFYSVGAMIGGTARLHAVYADRVILDRGGQLEALMLPRQAASLVAAPRAALPPTAGSNRFADNLRRMAETNPGALTEVIRPQPVFANGTQRGYRVYPGRNRQQFAKLGLQPGDLVTAVNGTPLDDPARGQEIMSALAASDRVNVTVERNGQTQQLTLNTAQISLPDASDSVNPPVEGPLKGPSPPGADLP